MAIQNADIVLRPYHCERCHRYHLTSRTKGKWMPKDLGITAMSISQ